MESQKVNAHGFNGLLPSTVSSVVALAISGSKKSKYVVRWAFDNLIPEEGPEKVCFKLLHVFPAITVVPTPMGGGIPISQVRDDIAVAYRKEVEFQAQAKLLPYKKACIVKKVQVEVVLIESDNVENAIADEIDKSNINKLVLGASSTGGMFSRGQNFSGKISECCPGFCTIYVVSKEKLASVRPSDPEAIRSTVNDAENTSSFGIYTPNHTFNSQPAWTSQSSTNSYPQFVPSSPPPERFQSMNQNINRRSDLNDVSPSDPEAIRSTAYDVENTSSFGIYTPNHTFNSQPAWTAQNSTISYPQFVPSSPPPERFQSMNQQNINRISNLSDVRPFHYIREGEVGSNNSDKTDDKSKTSSFTSWTTENTMNDRSSSLNNSISISSGSQVNINSELEHLRMELRHVRNMYAQAQTESIDASKKLNELQEKRLEEKIKLNEINIKEEEAKETAEQEKMRYEATTREAAYAKECAEKEAALKAAAEKKAIRDVKAKEKLESTLSAPAHHFQEFSWEEITSATLSFSSDLRVGMGSYGTVYKCTMRHANAAVKILHSATAKQTKEFLQELEILSKIRHPNLLTLLGACPGHGCLVYEYMENGNLDERLCRKGGTPPIPWFDRYRIAREVASALVFLHNSKPKPIIHRDLKPANILLDHNLVSKIGDVGLSTMLPSNASNTTMLYKDTSPVGTLCYIDPEYQRTGMVSPKSDVYALGMVLLQLLTAKPAITLAHKLEMAVEEDRLTDVLDPTAGKWPVQETTELALLALRCTEFRQRDRPDLKSEILPVLERLRIVSDNARDSASSGSSLGPFNHFICPILKDVMNEPCVAADGYTYDKKAMEEWLQEHDTSPVTNLPLMNKNLIPNYTILSAIIEWKSGKC